MTTTMLWTTWTLRDRLLAEVIADKRSRGLSALDPAGWTVVDGPEHGEYTVMTRRDAGELMECDGCWDGTPYGHTCPDAHDSCGRLRDLPAPDGCSCETDDAPVTLRAMRLEAQS